MTLPLTLNDIVLIINFTIKRINKGVKLKFKLILSKCLVKM